jgi:hypothetical protein
MSLTEECARVTGIHLMDSYKEALKILVQSNFLCAATDFVEAELSPEISGTSLYHGVKIMNTAHPMQGSQGQETGR